MSEETTTNSAPMRLRAEPPRVTRLSRKMLAGVGAAALLGIGGALIYALQTRDMSGNGEELYSTENRPTADGLAGLPRDYTGPVLGPALPGDLGGPILDAQNRGQPITPPAMATPSLPLPDPPVPCTVTVPLPPAVIWPAKRYTPLLPPEAPVPPPVPVTLTLAPAEVI